MSAEESSVQEQAADARRPGADLPGALRSQVWLTLQTRQALQLVRGRNARRGKPAIAGLIHFAERLRLIWQAARDDDPWADWWLVRIHESTEACVRYFEDREAQMQALLSRCAAMDVTVAGSERPSRVSLQFANPYAYRAARLLARFDTLVCMALTARRVGLLDSESSDQVIRSCGHRLRSAFTAVHEYRFTGASRESLSLGDAKSDEALAAMGEVPEEILSGEQRAPIVPRKTRFPAAFAEHGTLQAAPLPAAREPADAENGNP